MNEEQKPNVPDKGFGNVEDKEQVSLARQISIARFLMARDLAKRENTNG